MSVPASRTLEAVLREQLDTRPPRVTVGTVTAVPDPAHVTVQIGGGTITIPKLTAYSPVVGEPCYVIFDDLFTVALGATKATPPPGISNADLLDGIDSTGFWRLANDGAANTVLKRNVAGGEQIWWTKVSGTATGGQYTFNHPLGRVPTCVVALATVAGTAVVQKAEATTTQITLYVTGGTVLEAWVLIIG